MRQRPLGLFGFDVSLVGFGCDNLGGGGLGLEASLKVVHKKVAKTLAEV
jgi:hypothetical protein